MAVKPYTKGEILSIIERGPVQFNALLKGAAKKMTAERIAVREACDELIECGLVLLINISLHRYYILNTEDAKRAAVQQQIDENSRYDRGTGCIVWLGTIDSKRGPVMNQRLVNPASATNIRRWIYSDSTGRDLLEGHDSIRMRSQCVDGCINKDHMSHMIVNEMSANRGIMREVRELLRREEDGLTIPVIAQLIRSDSETVRKALKAMPDVYIDRYLPPKLGRYPAVWCAVQVPEHCPYPTKQAA